MKQLFKKPMPMLAALLIAVVIFLMPKPGGYYAGQIIYPDYANSDTLIVNNAEALNTYMPTCNGSDAEINKILHLYCKVKK